MRCTQCGTKVYIICLIAIKIQKNTDETVLVLEEYLK